MKRQGGKEEEMRREAVEAGEDIAEQSDCFGWHKLESINSAGYSIWFIGWMVIHLKTNHEFIIYIILYSILSISVSKFVQVSAQWQISHQDSQRNYIFTNIRYSLYLKILINDDKKYNCMVFLCLFVCFWLSCEDEKWLIFSLNIFSYHCLQRINLSAANVEAPHRTFVIYARWYYYNGS